MKQYEHVSKNDATYIEHRCCFGVFPCSDISFEMTLLPRPRHSFKQNLAVQIFRILSRCYHASSDFTGNWDGKLQKITAVVMLIMQESRCGNTPSSLSVHYLIFSYNTKTFNISWEYTIRVGGMHGYVYTPREQKSRLKMRCHIRFAS